MYTLGAAGQVLVIKMKGKLWLLTDNGYTESLTSTGTGTGTGGRSGPGQTFWVTLLEGRPSARARRQPCIVHLRGLCD